MYYIGIDVSKKDLSVFNGKLDLKFINQQGLRPFKKYLKKKYKNFSDLVIIFEPTGIYSFNLKEFCAENSIKAYILNPKRSHSFARSLGIRSKDDKIDARILYQFHRLIDSKDIKVPRIDQQTKVLSSYLTSYEFALKQRVAISNHLESLRDKKLTSLLKKELKRAKKLEDKIFNDIKEYIGQNQNLREDYQRLLTISVRGRAKISKNGKAIYRKVSYLPAICATVHNQKIKIFYQRLLANHKPKKVAIIASMRKILLIAHAMYRDKTEYVAA